MTGSPVERILETFREGASALLVTGRALDDLVVTDTGEVLTIEEHLRRQGRGRFGMHMLKYTLAYGLDFDAPRIDDLRDLSTIESALRGHALMGLQPGPAEVVPVLRGLSSLLRTPAGALRWSNGDPLRFIVLLQFAEHLAPSGEHGGRTDHEIVSIELAHLLGRSNALRRSGNLIVVHGRDGWIDPLVTAALHWIQLSQPDELEKRAFLTAATRVYPSATLDRGLTVEQTARLAANTPNRGLEAQLRRSARTRVPVGADDLLRQKADDVVMLSEGTLTTLDTRRVTNVSLVGRTVATPMAVLSKFGLGLLAGNPRIPSNLLLVGAPGTGKTDLALTVAAAARASAYQIHSPKGGIVGETERRTRAMTQALAEWTPNVAFADEITEMLPTKRSDFDGDSGATRAVTAGLLTALSDETRRGRSILIGTTNCPWRMGAAMRNRFTLLPVLSPLAEDFPAIVLALITRLDRSIELSSQDLEQSAEIFYAKGANARDIANAIGMALALSQSSSGSLVLEAALDLMCASDRVAAAYADLWAVRVCTSSRFLPWHGCANSFPYPQHLDGLVNPVSAEIDRSELARRLNELQPGANV